MTILPIFYVYETGVSMLHLMTVWQLVFANGGRSSDALKGKVQSSTALSYLPPLTLLPLDSS